MRGCCLTNLIVLGVTDPPTTPVQDMYFYHTTLTLSGGADNIDAGSYGASGIPNLSYASLSGFLSGSVTGDSGAWINFGDTAYVFWIVLPQASAPNDWTWNGDPIVFTDVGIVTKKCYEADFITPDPATYFLNGIGSATEEANLNGLFLTYDQPGQQPAWTNFISLFAGVGSSGTYLVASDNVVLTINNTYNVFDTAQSSNGINFPADPFTEVPC